MRKFLADLKSGFCDDCKLFVNKIRMASMKPYVEILETRSLMTTVIPFVPDSYYTFEPTDTVNISELGQYQLTGSIVGSSASTSEQAQEFLLSVTLPTTPTTVSVTLDSSTGPSIRVLLDVGAGPGVNIEGATISSFHGFFPVTHI